MPDNSIATIDRPAIDPAIMEKVIINGDLSNLTEDQRLSYYSSVCTSIGLNPLTQPFAYIRLNGKLTLYALKACTDQLRAIHDISITLDTPVQVGDILTINATARNAQGRTDADTGAVPVKGLQGEALSNAMMKAVTKAKRRVTLSICGLGMLDESETDSIPNATIVEYSQSTVDKGANPNDYDHDAVQRNYFKHAKDTDYATDDGRASFLFEHTAGKTKSLAEFLAHATRDEARAMLDDLKRRIAAGQPPRQPGIVIPPPPAEEDAVPF